MIANSIKLLIIEDNPGDIRILEEIFKNISDLSFNLESCMRLSEGVKKLEKKEFDLILLDLSLPDSEKTETLSTLLDKNFNIPIVVLTNLDDKKNAISSLKRGAQDYLVKGEIDKMVLSRSILYSIEHYQIKQKLKKSEEKFKNESDKLKNILSSLRDQVLIINKQFDIEYANPITFSEFGLIKGRKCYQYLFDRSSVCLTCKNNEIFDGKIIREEFFIKKNQKTYDFIETPLKKLDGSISKLCILHDITKLKQVEIKLKEINKVKSEFLNRVSHELKTPLVVIRGYLDLMLNVSQEDLNLNLSTYLEEMQKGYERLQKIVASVLKASQLESSTHTLNPKKENLSFLIRYCVKDLHPLIKLRNQSLKIEVDEYILIKIVKEEIYEVITNLLTNAIKYTPLDGSIMIKSEINGKDVIISIQDNGIGIDKKDKKQLFTKFGKIERYGQELDVLIDGTGLGLYISKMIIELHGGKIWVESDGRNKGSTFFFSLPIKNLIVKPHLLEKFI